MLREFGRILVCDLTHNRFKWNSYGLSIDYLLNFTNLILGFRENRKFHLQGIVGIGGSVSRNYTTGKFVDAYWRNY